jgi:hypothetical protein
MARVKITLKCEHCGKEFEHIHMCRNSTEAGSYEVWARENLATCPACYAEQKNAKRGAELSSYISSFSDRHPLPEITGVSEKQIAYASSLREKFICDEMLKTRLDVNRFFEIADKIKPENYDEAGRELMHKAAADAGKPFEIWFTAYRAERLRRYFGLIYAADAAKIETIFTENSASKIIDALR